MFRILSSLIYSTVVNKLCINIASLTQFQNVSVLIQVNSKYTACKNLIPNRIKSFMDVLSSTSLATRGANTFLSLKRCSSVFSNLPEWRASSCRNATANVSCECFRRSLICEQMLLASLDAKT